jgi:hypothetical protein
MNQGNAVGFVQEIQNIEEDERSRTFRTRKRGHSTVATETSKFGYSKAVWIGREIRRPYPGSRTMDFLVRFPALS